jgi:putative transposase
MRHKRFLAGANNRPVYHVVSRNCNKDFYLDEAGKGKVAGLIRKYAGYCGVEVMAYCVMSNHFHILVEVPPCEAEGLGDEELLRRLRFVYGEEVVGRVAAALAQAAALGGEAGKALRERVRRPHLRRMGVLAEFVKGIKQCFSQWFNKRLEREGTAWEGRFHSALVGGDSEEGTASVARIVAGYIDLNAVRAGLVEEAKDYPWCGYAAACRGEAAALWGLGRLLGRHAKGGKAATAEQLAAYGAALAPAADAGGAGGGPVVTPDGQAEAQAPRAGVEVAVALRGRLAGISRAAVVGEAGFVAALERRGLFAGRVLARAVRILETGGG